MYYYGPWREPGHYLHDELLNHLWCDAIGPWFIGDLDGKLQPKDPQQREGLAVLHHKEGWTALAFWDRTVDKRMACCSVYLADEILDFDEMVKRSKARFGERWRAMAFDVVLAVRADDQKV
jgi:hypothetical protein